MKRSFFTVLTGIVLSMLMTTAFADSRIVSLSVKGMTSPTCPVLLKSAVGKMKGVKKVEASLENHSATIEFDEKVTSLENIQDTIESRVGFSTHVK